MKPTVPALIADCATGDIVRTHSGVVRVCSLSAGGERWCRLILDGGREGPEPIWIDERTPVLEMLIDRRVCAERGAEYDPVQGRLR